MGDGRKISISDRCGCIILENFLNPIDIVGIIGYSKGKLKKARTGTVKQYLVYLHNAKNNGCRMLSSRAR